MKKNTLALGFTLMMLLVGAVVVIRLRDIRDWIALFNYEPSANIVALSERTDMTEYGRKLFYVYDPQLLPKQSFNENCPINEQTIVLGCYNGINIYIYDISDPQLAGVEEVTAAHEMLHAAYDRLSSSEKERIEDLLIQALSNNSSQRIADLVKSYQSRDPENLPNELHSIIGTEMRSIPQELEEYYARYFDDRHAVVAFSEQYEAVFSNLKNKAQQLQADLALRRAEIEQKEAALEVQSDQLRSESARLDNLRNSDPQAYNNSIDSYNAMVNSFNAQLAEVKILIAEYNGLVAQYNSVALQQSQLIHNLDSKYQEL